VADAVLGRTLPQLIQGLCNDRRILDFRSLVLVNLRFVNGTAGL
jgi:hypothetical protein